MIYIIVILVIVIILLSIKRIKEHSEDRQIIKNIEAEMVSKTKDMEQLIDTIAIIRDKSDAAKEEYQKVSNDLNLLREKVAFERQQQEEFFKDRDKMLVCNLNERKRTLDFFFEQYQQEVESNAAALADELEDDKEAFAEAKKQLESQVQEEKNKFNALIEPIQKLEKEEAELRYYCVDISEEDRNDILFLTNEVIAKLRHPDILRKLIWSEYYKNPVDALFKKLGIDDSPGIYKITNIADKKCYIGKAANVKKRLIDHIKGSIGIDNIAYQYVHDVMAENGIWNFTFERIITCEKEQLSESEKYYIDFFNSQEWGYNRKAGG